MSARQRAHHSGMALVHDYLTQYGGAETVLQAMHELWPHAPVFTTFYDADIMARSGLQIPPAQVHPLLPRWVPHGRHTGKLWTPLYPMRFDHLDLRGFQTVLSSSSFSAHHVRVAPGTRHICYCHSPPRFLYGLGGGIDHARLRRSVPYLDSLYNRLRDLDQAAARRVDAFIANSHEVQGRIRRIYGRDATVIYPPVDTAAFGRARTGIEGEYFLTYGRLVASKRMDLIVRGATIAHARLVVAGTGPEERRLRAAAGPSVTFTGYPDRRALVHLLERCSALVFAAEEDFGIVPVEAMAAGKPVIAYGKGGALETVQAGLTGEFFTPQTVDALVAALRAFDPKRYDPACCRARAALFDRGTFAARMRRFVPERT